MEIKRTVRSQDEPETTGDAMADSGKIELLSFRKWGRASEEAVACGGEDGRGWPLRAGAPSAAEWGERARARARAGAAKRSRTACGSGRRKATGPQGYRLRVGGAARGVRPAGRRSPGREGKGVRPSPCRSRPVTPSWIGPAPPNGRRGDEAHRAGASGRPHSPGDGWRRPRARGEAASCRAPSALRFQRCSTLR